MGNRLVILVMLSLSPLLERFVERTPLPVMARGLLERRLSGSQLDEWFETIAEKQYTNRWLCSDRYDLITQVVFRHQPSVNTAYQNAAQPLNVSKSAVYDKLQHLEPIYSGTCSAGRCSCVGTDRRLVGS